MRYLTAPAVVALVLLLTTHNCSLAAEPPVNLALVAAATTSYVSGHETINGLNSGHDPRNSDDKRHGAYGNWPQKGTQWVEYSWSQPIHTGQIDVYWFDDHRGVRLPKACRLFYDDGGKLVPVKNAKGFGLKEHQYNTTTFDDVHTKRLRLEMDSSGESTGILQWKVIDAGGSPEFPPQVTAGPDRAVIQGGRTWLNGAVHDPLHPNRKAKVTWSKESGPGEVSFDNAAEAETTASFSKLGNYVLKFTAGDGKFHADDTLRVEVVAPPPGGALKPVTMSRFTVTSPLLKPRLKQVIIHWIPHCYNKLSEPNLPEGGIENFVQAANKLAGKPAARHRGSPWANAYTHNTVESMCWALMYDPQGDAEIIAAQDAIRKKLDDWIPKILAAQQPNGYLQTMYTLNNLRPWTNKGDHEGYTAGYFIEAAIAHYLAFGKQKDDPMLRAARKLADCWYDQIGPAPKKTWYDGHEELELALQRLASLVDAEEGSGKGDKYFELSKFLLDSRRHGEWYDQSHLPVVHQYDAAGHAVRAAYLYTGMAGVAIKTGDVDYQSALVSIWQNIVNKRYYIIGGIGSGETSEGFGANYSLPNNAYCESCANCGLLFFQNKMGNIWRGALFADLAEDTYYNAVLGDVDLPAKNFTYTNELNSGAQRYAWHGCPCCVGNIPRTLLELPIWMYSTGKDALYVNMYAGSKVGAEVGGTKVEVEQKTDYPWKGHVTIVLHPAESKQFSVHLRCPDHDGEPSPLYTNRSEHIRLNACLVNGQKLTGEHFDVNEDRIVISQKWQDGDRIEFDVPLEAARIKADEHIAADRGRVALRYGPLVYCIESTDQNVNSILPPDAPLTTEWRPDLLDGVMVIKSSFADGRPMLAIPYYARANRGGRYAVWIRDK
jgi:DUF1680 family protein